MNHLTRRTVANVMAGMEPQFRKVCQEFPDYCTAPASWLVWSVHDGENHQESTRYSCHDCKTLVIEQAEELAKSDEMVCAHPLCEFRFEAEGKLGNVVRFIRL